MALTRCARGFSSGSTHLAGRCGKVSGMATAYPLPPEPVPARADEARARIRAAGLDPAAVPHAGAETLDGFRAEIGELMALGLEGQALVTVLAGPPVFSGNDPAALMEFLASIPPCDAVTMGGDPPYPPLKATS
jgi:hypothetical protein